MGTTTNFDVPYPDSTDAPNVPSDIQALADKLDFLLSIPAATNGSSSGSNAITATSYGNLPTTPISCAMTNPSSDYGLLCHVSISAWMASATSTTELTASVAGSGGMTFAAGSTGNGHALQQSENLLTTLTPAQQYQSTVPVVIPAGAAAVTFTFQAKRSAATSCTLNAPVIRCTPIRYVQ